MPRRGQDNELYRLAIQEGVRHGADQRRSASWSQIIDVYRHNMPIIALLSADDDSSSSTAASSASWTAPTAEHLDPAQSGSGRLGCPGMTPDRAHTANPSVEKLFKTSFMPRSVPLAPRPYSVRRRSW